MFSTRGRLRVLWLAMAPVVAGVSCAIPLARADAPPEPSGDACALLSTEQVSAALGVEVRAGTPVLPTTKALCTWTDPSGPMIGGKKLTLSLMTAKVFADGKNPSEGIAKSSVRGLGDEAYTLTSSGFGASLSVKKGETYLQLRVHGFRVDKAQDIEKALAQQLLRSL